MIAEICDYLKNYFDRDMPKYFGEIAPVLSFTFMQASNVPDLEGVMFTFELEE